MLPVFVARLPMLPILSVLSAELDTLCFLFPKMRGCDARFESPGVLYVGSKAALAEGDGWGGKESPMGVDGENVYLSS